MMMPAQGSFSAILRHFPGYGQERYHVHNGDVYPSQLRDLRHVGHIRNKSQLRMSVIACLQRTEKFPITPFPEVTGTIPIFSLWGGALERFKDSFYITPCYSPDG